MSVVERRPGYEGAPDWEGCVSAFVQAQQEAQDALWRMGEVAATVDRAYGTRAIPKFASDVGYSARRVYELAANWAAWEARERSQSLTFAHHEAIEAVTESDDEAEELRVRAEDEGMSVREIKRLGTGDEERLNVETLEMIACAKCGEAYPLREANTWTKYTEAV